MTDARPSERDALRDDRDSWRLRAENLRARVADRYWYGAVGVSIGYGLGATFAVWPGGLWASGVGLALAVAALFLTIRALRQTV